MKFGTHLQQARLARTLTQGQVARDFYVTRQTISSWENETTYPDITNLIKFSDYYHISLDELIKEDSGMKDYLKKQDIIKSIRPVIILLTIIDLLFLGIFAFYTLHLMQFSKGITWLLTILMIMNAVALIQLSSFQANLNTTKRHHMLGILTSIIAIALIMLGIGLAVWADKMLLGGILAGLGAGALISLFLRRLRPGKVSSK